jgi:hypothetical protein
LNFSESASGDLRFTVSGIGVVNLGRCRRIGWYRCHRFGRCWSTPRSGIRAVAVDRSDGLFWRGFLSSRCRLRVDCHGRRRCLSCRFDWSSFDCIARTSLRRFLLVQ